MKWHRRAEDGGKQKIKMPRGSIEVNCVQGKIIFFNISAIWLLKKTLSKTHLFKTEQNEELKG